MLLQIELQDLRNVIKEKCEELIADKKLAYELYWKICDIEEDPRFKEAQEPRKKGYWKYPQSLDCCCSECGNQPDHEPGESVPLYDYCPYCGAEMEG